MKLVRRPLLMAICATIMGSLIVVITCIPKLQSDAAKLLFEIRGKTGTIHVPLKGGFVESRHYISGLRDGAWIVQNSQGEIIQKSVYRNGKPWDGICRIFDEKMFIGEYKDGRPWNGCLPVENEASNTITWSCFINGYEVTYDEYCKINHVEGSDNEFIGLHMFKPKGKTQKIEVPHE